MDYRILVIYLLTIVIYSTYALPSCLHVKDCMAVICLIREPRSRNGFQTLRLMNSDHGATRFGCESERLAETHTEGLRRFGNKVEYSVDTVYKVGVFPIVETLFLPLTIIVV